MKPFLYLVIYKQWKQYLLLFCILLCSLGTLWVVQKTSNQTFHIPIAIQDLDQSANSKTLIKQLKQEPILEVSTLPLDDNYIEESVTKKEAIISMQIPKNYSSQLEQNDLHEAILLYGRDDFIGNISLEIVSQSLYNQQIPYLVHAHVQDANSNVTLNQVKSKLTAKTPASNVDFRALHNVSNRSLSMSIIFGLLLCISSIQILLHHNLKQNAPLQRLYLAPLSKLKLYGLYVVIHAIVLLLVLWLSALLFQQQLSVTFYLTTLLVIIIYELGISWLLFTINTLSHRLFMALIYAIAITLIYIYLQF